MSGHTPGPWRSDGEVCGWDNGRNPAVRVTYYKGGGVSSPVAMCSPRVGEQQAIANANLIAAAPDLAKAADALARELEHWVEWKNGNAMPPQREKGRDALRLYREAKAKAKGSEVPS